MEELEQKCQDYVESHLPSGLDLDAHQVAQITQTVLDALLQQDALEDRYDSRKLHLFHFNDCYNSRPAVDAASAEPDHPYGGFARFWTVFQEQQAACSGKPLVLFSENH